MKREFQHERKFSRWLSDYLDGATVKRGVRFPNSDVGDKFTLQTAHESGKARSDAERPDIEVFHDIEFDLQGSPREDTVAAPTNPFYIECKIGGAYRKPGHEVKDRTDTGIPALQRCLAGQLQAYQRNDHERQPTAEITPSPGWSVFVTCPYMLDGVFHEKVISGFSAGQFEQTLRGLGLGWVYRHSRGIALQLDSNNSYLVLERGTEMP